MLLITLQRKFMIDSRKMKAQVRRKFIYGFVQSKAAIEGLLQK